MKRMDRRAMFASGAAAALLAATGVSARAMPRRGGRLVAALSGAARDDDWRRAPRGLFMAAAFGSVFEGLTQVTGDGLLRGMLASAWRVDAGGLVWTFDLRRGVRWHDGTPLHSRHVVAGLHGIVDGDVRAAGAAVVITLRQPQHDLPWRLAQPDAVIRRPEGTGSVGTGMYAVRRFDAGRQIIMDRVEGHYRDGEAGWFDTVELVSIPSEDVRAEAMLAGLVDVADVRRGLRGAGFVHVPDASAPRYVTSAAIGMPDVPGSRAPLDDLRMAERWWRLDADGGL